ncbi:MAG TPA: response regulator [Longimicrobiaceae bacterium]|nr:response regulator [Longimicrobiaceae bacterium]
MTESAARVLLVEDDAAIRGAFTLLLEDCGYAVQAAGTGADALRLAAAGRPDVVVLDMGLPDTTGVEVARALTASSPDKRIPIVALTGRALESDRDAAFAAGCVRYLVKPVSTRDLLGAIEELAAG